jgi:hypothetical protein
VTSGAGVGVEQEVFARVEGEADDDDEGEHISLRVTMNF